MANKPRLFLDTSALFAGIWSAEGGARMLLRLGEADVVQLLISSQVLVEIEQVVRRKAAQHLPTLAVLIDHSRAQVVASAPPELTGRCREWVPHPGDAQILADAWHTQADFLVTLDRAHFLDAAGLVDRLPFRLGTPGDCLAWLRALWQVDI
jgi:predicted nucleic acid-binding protein